MPFPVNMCPKTALLVAVNAPELAGVNIFDRGSSVTMSSTVLRWRDLYGMLTGYGSQTGRDLLNDFRDQWIAAVGGTPTVEFGINASDRLFVKCDAAAFSLNAHADNEFFGFDKSGQSSVAGGGTNTITAVADWSRDQPINKHLQFQTGANTWYTPSVPYRAQGIPTLIRKAATTYDADNDYTTTCIEYLDNQANDAGGGRRIRWGLDAQGRAWNAFPAGAGISSPTITAAGDPFRKLIGAYKDKTRTEETLTGRAGDLFVITYPGPCAEAVMTFSRAARLRRARKERTEGTMLTDREIVTGSSEKIPVYRLLGYLDGPGDKTAPRHEHFLDFFLDRATLGELVTAVYGWPGEVRRAANRRDAGAAYDESYTTQGYSDHGRILLRRSLDDDPGKASAWTNERLRKRGLLAMEFIRAEDTA